MAPCGWGWGAEQGAKLGICALMATNHSDAASPDNGTQTRESSI